MGTRFRAENPEKHEYSLTMTMTLKDWLELREQLVKDSPYGRWPASLFVREITDMIAQAQKIYWPALPKPLCGHEEGHKVCGLPAGHDGAHFVG
jgi:hypothetical protein